MRLIVPVCCTTRGVKIKEHLEGKNVLAMVLRSMIPVHQPADKDASKLVRLFSGRSRSCRYAHEGIDTRVLEVPRGHP